MRLAAEGQPHQLDLGVQMTDMKISVMELHVILDCRSSQWLPIILIPQPLAQIHSLWAKNMQKLSGFLAESQKVVHPQIMAHKRIVRVVCHSAIRWLLEQHHQIHHPFNIPHLREKPFLIEMMCPKGAGLQAQVHQFKEYMELAYTLLEPHGTVPVLFVQTQLVTPGG